MPFFAEIIQKGQTLGAAWAVTEQALGAIEKATHPERHYKPERDVPIIEAAKDAYKATFPGKPLPIELQYLHETLVTGDTAAAASVPETKRPPRDLRSGYHITTGMVRQNIISQECNAAVIHIYSYLDELNKHTDGITDRMLHNYGHRNDAIRFLFCLIAHAFIQLSSENLNDMITLMEAEAYINFLVTLKKDARITLALRDISIVDLEIAHGKSIKTTPLSMLVSMCKRLESVKEILLDHRAKCSVFEHSEVLFANVQQLIQDGFFFSTYILAAFPIPPGTLMTSAMDTNAISPRCVLQQLLAQLSNSLHLSQSLHRECLALEDNIVPRRLVAPFFFSVNRSHRHRCIRSAPREMEQFSPFL